MGERAQDPQPQALRDVTRIAEPGVERVDHHGTQHAQAGTRQEGHDHQERCDAADRLVRLDGSIEDADVGQRRRLRDAGFVVALLERGVELSCYLHFPLQACLLKQERRDVAQVADRRVHPLPEVALPRGQVVAQRAQHARDRAAIERRYGVGQLLDGEVLIRVGIAQGAELGLLVGQLLQRLRQLR